MNERIKKLRKVLDLTQQEFADKIGVKRNTIATYEIGRNQPIDAVISLICREFNVSEAWLRTGEGEMFVERTRDDELSAFVDELMKEQPADFRRRLVTALSRLKPEQWEVLEALALSLMDNSSPPDGGSKLVPQTKLYIAARDGSRFETEADGEIILPDEDAKTPE